MTKRRSTKSALISAVLILAMTFTSFVGTTFAWFTDSVTSANNIIKSGNLDVEVYYQNDTVTSWTKVDTDTNVFKTNTLWEPGHVEVIRLKVVNEGSLSFKYTLGVNVASEVGSVNVYDEDFKLSDYIMFGIADGAEDYTREEAIKAVADNAASLSTSYSSGTLTLDAKNDTDSDEQIVTLVVYMPESVGNDANAKAGAATPTINLGINVFATQTTAEKDSFDDQYDAATWKTVYTAEDLIGALAAGEKNISLGGNIVANSDVTVPGTVTTYSLRDNGVVIDLNGYNITAGNDSVNLHIYGKLTVMDSVGGGISTFRNHRVYEGGMLTLESGTLQNVATATGGFGVYVNEGGAFVMNGGAVKAVNQNNYAVSISNGAVAEINNGEISGNFGCLNNSGELVINNGTFNVLAGIGGHCVYVATTGQTVINDGDFNPFNKSTSASSYSAYVAANGKLVVNGGSFESTVYNQFACSGADGADITIYNGNFDIEIPGKYIADGFHCEEDENGNFVVVVGSMISTADDLAEALSKGGKVILGDDIVLPDVLTIPTGVTVELDLNGKKVSTVDTQSTYAFNNLGKLILTDSVGTGSITARGIYNGYGNGGENITTAEMVINGVTIDAKGTNGGAAVYNYAKLEIQSGNFTSVGGYALNNQSTGTINLANANVRGGIYNYYGTLVVENSNVYQHISGRHAIYNFAANLVINSGSFDSESGNELILADGTDASVVINGGTFDKTAKSWLFGAATGKNITFQINGGTFNGYVNKPENTVDTVRPYGDKFDITGGTFNFDPTTWVVDGYKATKNADGSWTVTLDGVMVSTLDELKAAVAEGGNIYVTADLDIPEGWSATVTKDKVAKIDLMGHTLNLACKQTVFAAVGHLTMTNGTINAVSTAAALAAPVNVSGGTLDLDNIVINVSTLEGIEAECVGVSVAGGTLNLNEGALINVNSALCGYGVYVVISPATINFNGGKISVNATEDSEAHAVIGQTNFTVNANSGEVSVNAGADHYGFYVYKNWGTIDLQLSEGFVLNVADGANAYNSEVNVTNK